MNDQFHLLLNQASIESLSMFANTASQPLETVHDDILSLETSDNMTDDNMTDDALKGIVHSLDAVMMSAKKQTIYPINLIVEKMLHLIDILIYKKQPLDSDRIDCLLASTSQVLDLIHRIQSAVSQFSGTEQIIDLSEKNDSQADLSQWMDDEIKRAEDDDSTQSIDNENPGVTAKASDLHESPPLQPAETDLCLDSPLTPEEINDIGFTQQMVQDYISEAQDYIKNSEDALLDIENDPSQLHEKIDILLRAFHSLKGNSGLLLSVIKNEDLRRRHIVNKIKHLTHSAETLAQVRRDRTIELSSEEMELLFKVCDSVKWMINAFFKGDHTGRDMSDLHWTLQQISRDGDQKSSEDMTSDSSIPHASNIHKDSALVKTLKQIIEIMETGIKELSNTETRLKAAKKMTRGLKTLGKTASAAQLPRLSEISETAIQALENMLQNWNQDAVASGMAILASVPVSVGNIVAEKISVLSSQKKDQVSVSRRLNDDFMQGQTSGDLQTSMIKVPQERLDHLMNLIGELVVRKNGLSFLARSITIEDNRPDIGSKVKDAASAIGRIGDELQASIMSVRMTPVNHVFNRFPRLVRDLARETGKTVKLILKGQDTELDKKIIEAIGSPLVHLVRNSVDHGIETPENRKKAGKPAQAELILNAYNEGNNVIIEVQDDGQGIDAGKIGAVAVKRGLIDVETLDKMTDEHIRQLIFTPGFSSAKTVTDISGRGVGMDVVRREIEAISGTIHLQTIPGKMTSVGMRLPLTLAVSRGLNVAVNNEHYYLPLEYISETVKVHESQFHTHRGEQMVLVRNQILPVKALSDTLLLHSETTSDHEGMRSMVIMDVMGQKSALIVDRFFREEEYVIKTIEGPLGKFSEFMGATITSDGNVILVLNPLKL
ncbi:MAG: chemotaxis protein CheA [Candidatus Magnetomorum sp.]|nr:chemotaxis protein CheA [Candidatus Magnetomorum sp.]